MYFFLSRMYIFAIFPSPYVLKISMSSIVHSKPSFSLFIACFPIILLGIIECTYSTSIRYGFAMHLRLPAAVVGYNVA